MGALVLARHLRHRCRALDDPPPWWFVWVAVAASTGALPSFQIVSVGVGLDEDARIPWSMAGLVEMDVGVDPAGQYQIRGIRCGAGSPRRCRERVS